LAKRIMLCMLLCLKWTSALQQASKQANEYTMLCHARMRDTQHML
jgi:hypothetical protein